MNSSSAVTPNLFKEAVWASNCVHSLFESMEPPGNAETAQSIFVVL